MTALGKVIGYSFIVIRKTRNAISMNDERQANNKRGFTLIELMVAISIVAILATVGLVMYSTVQKSARISKRVQDLQAIQVAIELFKSATGYYPSIVTLGTPICADGSSGGANMTGVNALSPTYMPSVPRDPLQPAGTGTNCYLYQSNAVTSTTPNPGASEYKLRTSVPAAEMSDNDYRNQPSLIDPKRDTGSVDCTVEAGGAVTAWAVYSGSAACAY